MPLDKSIEYTKSRRKRPLILVTNDDGIYSKGLKALVTALKTAGDVLVTAPHVEQSATSHALTLYRPLRCDKIAKDIYAVDGTPTDCINLAVNLILKGKKPDCIFSGINSGPNLGDDIHYSGTVSAAVEGGIMDIPSVAISIGSIAGLKKNFKYKTAAGFAKGLVRTIIKKGLPKGVILNINVPNIQKNALKGCKVTILGKKNYSNITNEKIDPRGRKYYWIHGEETGHDDIKDSDCNAVADGFVSITPIRVNPTAYSFLKKMKKWRF